MKKNFLAHDVNEPLSLDSVYSIASFTFAGNEGVTSFISRKGKQKCIWWSDTIAS